MKKAIPAKPRPTNLEAQQLGNYFYLPGWQFDELILPYCSLLQSVIINPRGTLSIKADIYGLNARRLPSKEPCLANFFIRYHSRVYQTFTMMSAIQLSDLLIKEYWYDQYSTAVLKQQSAKQSSKKADIKKIKSVDKKVA